VAAASREKRDWWWWSVDRCDSLIGRQISGQSIVGDQCGCSGRQRLWLMRFIIAASNERWRRRMRPRAARRRTVKNPVRRVSPPFRNPFRCDKNEVIAGIRLRPGPVLPLVCRFEYTSCSASASLLIWVWINKLLYYRLRQLRRLRLVGYTRRRRCEFTHWLLQHCSCWCTKTACVERCCARRHWQNILTYLLSHRLFLVIICKYDVIYKTGSA